MTVQSVLNAIFWVLLGQFALLTVIAIWLTKIHDLIKKAQQ